MADRKPDLGLSDILKPLWALVAAGLVGFVYWIASSVFPNTVPSLTASVIGFIAFGIIVLIWGMMAAWPRVQKRLDDLKIPVAKGDRLSILVAELANDSDGTLTERIEHALAEQFQKRVEVLRPRKN